MVHNTLSRRVTRYLRGLTATGVAILLALGITAALHARVANPEPRPGRGALPVSVTGFTERSSYLREQRFLGTVQAATRSDVGFEIAGVIASVEVEEGQFVAAGEILARLDRRSLLAARAVAEATVEQVRAELELARSRLARQTPLVTSGAVSAQSFDDTRLGEKALSARLAAAQAELERLDVDLDKSVLRAPYDARIGRQYLDHGSVTRAGDPLLALLGAGDREARIGIAVEQAGELRSGDRYGLTLRDREVPAQLRAIRPDIDPVTLTAAALFTLPADVVAYDGEPVSIRLPQRISQSGGWLPLGALLEGDRGVWTVLALRQRGDVLLAVREVVEVLHVSGDEAYVRGTLNDGDRVVSDGVHRIAPGTRITIAAQQRLAGS